MKGTNEIVLKKNQIFNIKLYKTPRINECMCVDLNEQP